MLYFIIVLVQHQKYYINISYYKFNGNWQFYGMWCMTAGDCKYTHLNTIGKAAGGHMVVNVF